MPTQFTIEGEMEWAEKGKGLCVPALTALGNLLISSPE